MISVLMLSGSLRRFTDGNAHTISVSCGTSLLYRALSAQEVSKRPLHTAIKGHLNSMLEEGMDGGGRKRIETRELSLKDALED